MAASIRLTLGSVVALSWLAVGCSSSKKIDVGGSCLLNSDCDSPLVCTMNRCHAGCKETRDCPAGQSCTMMDGTGVCQLPAEAECSASAACADSRWICASDLRCRAKCMSADDCSTGQVCTRNVCADGKDLDVTTGQLPQKQPLADAGALDSAVEPDVASGPEAEPDPGVEAGPDLGVDTASPLMPAKLIAAPETLPFSSVAQGQTSKESTVTLVNGGEEDSDVITFDIDNAEFAILGGGTGDCASRKTILKPNDSCTIRITLTPTGTGVRSGKLTFSASPGGNGEVSLSGTGACPVDTLADGTGQCVPMAGAEWVQRGPLLTWASVASSADGTRLVAAATGGSIYTSSDSGATWIARDSVRTWTWVASSADGSRLLAGDLTYDVPCRGDLFTSTDFGVSWNAGGQADCWRVVASAADGVHLFAASGGPGTMTPRFVASSDGGSTWKTTSTAFMLPTRIAVSADGTRLMVVDQKLWLSADSGSTWTTSSAGQLWSAAALSGDGSLLVSATSGSAAGYIYLSRDDGASWSEVGPAQNYASVASSSDGKRLLAGVDGGYLLHSVDGGKTWAQRGSVRSWKAVASSADGTKLVAVATNGYIYTSIGPLP
jgi:hypothetical protein